MKITIVVLSGGSGRKLWPLVTQDKPKPFCKILSKKTLLEETILRFEKLGDLAVVAPAYHLKLAKEVLSDRSDICYIQENLSKGTALSIATAAKTLIDSDYLLITPSDHYIKDPSPLFAGIEAALPYAEKGEIVAFGITPTQPETRYGYIEMGLDHKIIDFIEKPPLEKAKEIYGENRFFYNSGIFLAKPSAFLTEWEKYQTEDAVSFETAVMEKTSRASVIPVMLDWDDLGCWRAIIRNGKLLEKENNRIFGDVKIINTEGSFIYSSGKKIQVNGVENIICVESDQGILITHIDQIDQIE